MSSDGDAGWPERIGTFLADLAAHNDRGWFERQRDRYTRDFAAPGKALLDTLGPRLARRRGTPVEGKLFRIHRDMRFARGGGPYHPWLRLGFWSPGRAGGHFLSLEADRVTFGAGCLAFDPGQREAYRAAIVADASGEDFAARVAALRAAGLRIDPPELKRPPPGYRVPPGRADWLCYKQLTAWRDAVPAAFPSRSALLDWCEATAATLGPLAEWLDRHLPAPPDGGCGYR